MNDGSESMRTSATARSTIGYLSSKGKETLERENGTMNREWEVTDLSTSCMSSR
jgi:hypothetical protein